uniref:Antolefinin n=1 Tax=Ditylenchus dipsaci TaxID=166011 RepID=A0A915DAM8_9BILA
MKHARYRLGNLLSVIRKGEIVVDAPREEIEPAFDEEVKRGPGRPKKLKREKRVVFELRGKPFGLRDSGYPESIYALCRKWMYGKDDEPEIEKEEEQPYSVPRFQSLDLMATKEIFSLPLPRHDIPLMDPRPQKVLRSEPITSYDKENTKKNLENYCSHWKNVKKSWSQYNRKREQRYSNSIQLLRTVYGIAQQTM